MPNLLLSDSFSIWCVSLLSKETFQICGINRVSGENSSTDGEQIFRKFASRTRKTFWKFSNNVCCFRYSKMNNLFDDIIQNIWSILKIELNAFNKQLTMKYFWYAIVAFNHLMGETEIFNNFSHTWNRFDIIWSINDSKQKQQNWSDMVHIFPD